MFEDKVEMCDVLLIHKLSEFFSTRHYEILSMFLKKIFPPLINAKHADNFADSSTSVKA